MVFVSVFRKPLQILKLTLHYYKYVLYTVGYKTDYLLYANGSPYVFTTSAGGINTQIQLLDNSIDIDSNDIVVNGLTAWSGTYSTADGRVATITKGIITDIS